MNTEQARKIYKEYQDDIISWWQEDFRKMVKNGAKNLRKQRRSEELKAKKG